MSPRPEAGAPILIPESPEEQRPRDGPPHGRWIIATILTVALVALFALLKFARPQPDLGPSGGPMVEAPRPRIDAVGPEETFGAFLDRHQVDSVNVFLALRAVQLDPDEVFPGTLVRLFRGSESGVTAIAFERDEDHRIELTLENRLWTAHSTGIGWTGKPMTLAGIFGDSSWAELDSASAGAVRPATRQRLSAALANILAWQIDVGRRIVPGDSFRVVAVLEQSSEGNERIRDIRAIRLTVSGRKLSAYRFSSTAGAPFGYFDDQGRALSHEFIRAPLLTNGRYSSQYMTRVHPVLGTIRAHRGVDYPAPEGTPVIAAAGGVVTYAGPGAALGNFIEIDHGNGVTTRYGHLSRISGFAARGYRVRRGQTIGYVGATGLATAPHLHYEFRVRGEPIDMRLLDVDPGRSIEPIFQDAFASARARLEAQLGPVTQRGGSSRDGQPPPPAGPPTPNQ